ncbi:uncharacterized protein LOC111042467 [Myzus persicae]|uniref:uncharacterized protein LOC111042467 n=1 Tax=Myzus persicae TaxID=13164 RepID=UPI000B939DE6|nr:uncharacterized protein LOC111042467 [Myzus persicae]
MYDKATSISRRGTIKGRLTRLYNFVQNFPELNGDINQLKIRKTTASECWNEFQKIQQEIEQNAEDAHVEEAYRIEVEELYFDMMASCETLVEKMKLSDETNVNEDEFNQRSSRQSTTIAGRSGSGTSNQASIVKLAALSVPEYSGDYKEWATFHDMFVALIHSNEALTDVQRFFYLKSALTGEAAKMIKSFETSAKNYTIAWECLKERYNNKRILVKNHTKAIFDLKHIDQESSAKLRYFIDSLQGHRKALEALGYETKNWGPLLVHIILIKLDTATLREWETQANKTEVSEVDELVEFLQKRFQILEAVEGVQKLNIKNDQKGHQSSSKSKKNDGAMFQKTNLMHATTTKLKCYVCNESHPIYRCPTFLVLSIPERKQKIDQLKICVVCLSKHAENKCKFKGCRKCGDKHNTLLHTTVNDDNSEPTASTSINAHAAGNVEHTHVLLSTAIINIRGKSNEIFCARALLDSGSQSNFITQELAQKLQLDRKKVNFAITGIDGATNHAHFSVTTAVQSRTTAYKETLEFLILPKITPNLPIKKIKLANSSIPNYVKLADPSYTEPGKIDVLIGAERFFEILKSGKYKSYENGPVFQETELGWVVAGLITEKTTANVHTFVTHTTNKENVDPLQNQLAKFWNLEEIATANHHDQDEKRCVEHFENTVKRGDDGKFIIQLPVTKEVEQLGDSRIIAQKRFLALENRLRRDRKLYEGYKEFINEYLQLGHMEIAPCKTITNSNTQSYFMPHHAVCRDNSLTTKIRVVFDASCATYTGLSLNDVLLKGPAIQDELICIVSRFRTHKYVLSADIKQMYRQIWVSEKDKNLQKILWRFKPDDEIKEYRLKTVTYGTKPASYIATGCLKKLSDEYKTQYPVASEVIAADFYMDDLLSGANSLEETITLRNNLITILHSAGLQLRKWVANKSQVLADIANVDNDPLRVLNLDNSPIKMLGLFWNPHNDTYEYKVNDPSQQITLITKRTILSNIATIFDPLGLIGPVVITAKIIMQKLWHKEINWDEQLPLPILKEWDEYCKELVKIEQIVIPRRIIGCDDYVNIQVHGFADASTVAYGACIYLRTTDRAGKHYTRLIIAKSRVAPLKTISLARLELCAAVLLVRLTQKIIPKLRLNITQQYYWSDSSIVLAWINAPSSRWKTFVAHRIGEIHEATSSSQWRHVKSENNPADIISRGCTPNKLWNNVLWWEGPPWINSNEDEWPQNMLEIKITENEIPEKLKSDVVSIVAIDEMSIIEKYSSLSKLLRVVAYIMRWKGRVINKLQFTTRTITLDEFNDSKERIIKIVQKQHFSKEINCLKQSQNVSNKSMLRFWRPWLDNNNILRVGGRLNKAESICNDKRNPIILPEKSTLTKLIFEFEHRRLLHAWPQALLAGIREKYWPMNGRNLARKIVHKCVRCFRTKPIICQPICGDLPKDRIEPGRAFEVCGVDYAGPILVKSSLRRNAQPTKGYICVFICFATKAAHLELVGDLSTNAFLAALRRFWSRRGPSKAIYSDNGTNFVGANRQLQELRDLFLSDQHNQRLQEVVNEVGVQWKFIPPRAPHFGGLWEAAVKSVKGHLRKILGNAMLTYEELYTVLVRIEAV